MPLSAREEKALARWRPAKNRLVNRMLAWFVINLSKLIMTRMNSLEIEGLDRFISARGRSGRGLLTYSNHVSLFDDPLLTSNLPLGGYDDIRWVAADALNFFGSRVKAFIFSGGKAVPIVRGAGFNQPGFDFLRDRLIDGDWVHVFPEGGRTRKGEGRLGEQFKAGLGRLIVETKPLALPFYHHGMHEILPIGAKTPRRGQHVRLVFGEPIDFNDDLIAEIAGPDESAQRGPQLWEAVTKHAYDVLNDLERSVRPDGAEA
jgi:monolysocardiolipin acyltransferase